MATSFAVQSITITIVRDAKPIGNALCGQLVCGNLKGETLEDDKMKIKEGVYKGHIHKSVKSGISVILLDENDTKRKGILIRNGNYVTNAGGSILVGMKRGKDPNNGSNAAVLQSRPFLKSLVEMCGNSKIKVIVTSGSNSANDDDEKKKENEVNINSNEIYIDRVYVIRCKVKSILPKIRGLSHSALLFSTKQNMGWYVLEYSDERRSQLYPATFDVLATYHQKYHQEIRFSWGGDKWTKQLNGSEPTKLWSINKAKQVIDDAFKDEYAISENKCCHIAQQIVRKAMGLTVDKEFDINKYPHIIKKGFSFIGY